MRHLHGQGSGRAVRVLRAELDGGQAFGLMVARDVAGEDIAPAYYEERCSDLARPWWSPLNGTRTRTTTVARAGTTSVVARKT